MDIGLFFLTAWGKLKSAVAWVFSDLRRLLTIALAIAIAVAWWQSGKLADCREDFANYRTAVDEASKKNAEEQAALIAAQKEKFDEEAAKADAEYESALAAARSAADRYKLANRVQNASRIRPAASPTEADPSLFFEIPAADSIMVSEPDFDTCTVNSTYARSAYEWGQSLIAEGVAE